MSTEYHSAQEDFNILISKLPPWVMSNFVIWLDLKVAEYKIFGRILSESEKYEAKEFFTGHSTKSADSHASQESTPRQNTSIHHQHQQRNEVGPFPEILVKVQPRNTTTNRPPKRKRPDKASYLSKRGIQQTSIDKGSASSQSQESCLPELGLRIIDSSGNPLDGDLCNKQTAECVNLDTDENTNDSEPVDSEPVDTKPEEGLLMEVSNESEIEQRETLSETQSSGLVSVIKLELPDNDVYQVLPTMQQSNESEMNIQSSSSWQPPSTSNEESLTTDASVAAEIEKSLQAEMYITYDGKCPGDDGVDSEQAKSESNDQFNGNGGKRTYTCSSCPYTSSRKYNLDRHMKSHENTTPKTDNHVCHECGNQYTTRYMLSKHLVLKHSEGESNYKCKMPDCKKEFMEKSKYIAHFYSHVGNKQLRCDLCKTNFRYQYNLNKHAQKCGKTIHPLDCDVCGDRFSSKKTLDEHKKGKHSGFSYRCICGETFRWRSTFAYHKKKCVALLNKI